MKKTTLLLLFLLSLCGLNVNAQEQKATLFPYPVVPDTISTLENRSNYFIAHFWDNCNFSKPISDLEGLNKAFAEYAVFYQYANKNVVKTSINDIMNKSQANMKNFWALVDIAERNLYSTEATFPSDEAYSLYIYNIMRSSKVKKGEKQRYQAQLEKINKNQIGTAAPVMDYVDINGDKKSLYDIKAPTVILFFNDPDCEDCSIARLRLSTNVILNNLIKDNKLAIVSIYPGKYSKDWAATAKGYSDNWIIGASENAEEIYDLRISPSIYLLDADKKILNKHLRAEDILNSLNR